MSTITELRRQLADAEAREARRANQSAVAEIVANPEPSQGFANAVKAMDARDSARRMQMAREIIRQNPGLLDSNSRTSFLMNSIPDLGPSEAREVLKEFDPSIADSRW